MKVIKIGGNELNTPGFKEDLAAVLLELGLPVVVVHGGGKDVDDLQTRLGQKPIKIHGLRQTDEEALKAALMVLCGLVGKELAAALITNGVDAFSLSGVDGGLLSVEKLQHPEVDLGYVGEIVAVRDELLSNLLNQGITPVISPISLGTDGQIYNVNADQAASRIAIALQAESLHFISNVPGVLKNGHLLPNLNSADVEKYITDGDIQSGMVPKVHAALSASNHSIPDVRIVDLANLTSGGGTRILSNSPKTALSNQPSIHGGKS